MGRGLVLNANLRHYEHDNPSLAFQIAPVTPIAVITNRGSTRNLRGDNWVDPMLSGESHVTHLKIDRADQVEDAVRQQLGQKTIGEEGRRTGRWVLLDYGDIVVHVFHKPVRAYYELERLFADAPQLKLEEPAWVHELDGADEGANEYNELVWQGVKWQPGDAAALVDDAEAAQEDEEEMEQAALAADDEPEELTEIE